MDSNVLSYRDKAILRAVHAGRAELLVSRCPDIAIDGAWCDHVASAQLVADGWIRAARPGRFGEKVAAELTDEAYAAAGTWLPEPGFLPRYPVTRRARAHTDAA